MPITKAAKKKLRQDAKRQSLNLKVKKDALIAVKKFKKTRTAANLSNAFSAIDTAFKKNIFHKNKAARMKSAISRMISTKKPAAKAAPDKSTKTVKKSAKSAGKK